jgi:hypothetical protein
VNLSHARWYYAGEAKIPQPYSGYTTNTLRRNLKMTTTSKILHAVLITLTLASVSAYADDDSNQGTEQRRSTTLAKWKVGDTKCAVVDGQVRCALR